MGRHEPQWSLLRLGGGEGETQVRRLMESPAGLVARPSSAAAASGSHGATAAGLGTQIGRHLRIRQAMLADVPQLQRINLVCLPENYHQQSYWFHILRWPTLIQVAEAQLDSAGSEAEEKEGQAGWAIVAYVLAKIDDGTEQDVAAAENSHGSHGVGASEIHDGHVTGHITSLAVMRTHRRLGIAKKLMKSSMQHMAAEYRASSCSLHVRCGNKAAVNLYRASLGFEVEKTVKGYYGDGEDAMCMRSALQPPPGAALDQPDL